MAESDEIMTLTQVCKELGISQNTAYARIADGTLKTLPVSPLRKRQRYRFSRADVERLKAPAAPRDGQGEG